MIPENRSLSFNQQPIHLGLQTKRISTFHVTTPNSMREGEIKSIKTVPFFITRNITPYHLRVVRNQYDDIIDEESFQRVVKTVKFVSMCSMCLTCSFLGFFWLTKRHDGHN